MSRDPKSPSWNDPCEDEPMENKMVVFRRRNAVVQNICLSSSFMDNSLLFVNILKLKYEENKFS